MADSFDFRSHQEYRVPVDGGEVAVLRWAAHDPQAETVVLVHGITANAMAWAGVVAAVAGRANLVALDLRGRAGSRQVAGPWGIDQDVRDVIAVLDHAGLDRIRLVGHSLGAFVAGNVARLHPDRVGQVLAVDGGIGFPVPAGIDPDAVLAAVLGPAMSKLAMTFPDAEAYLDFHRVHPAFVGSWTPEMTAYLGRDTFVQEDGTVVSSCVVDAIRVDGAQILVDTSVVDSIKQLSCPVTLLYAERGLLNEEQALYDEYRLALAQLPAGVETVFVPGTNHYTIVGPGIGADTIAEHILAEPKAE
jgi:pimeloyl-ACP methyl ester carboxylesterase